MTKRQVESQPKLKLYYFDIKGKGEPIRLFCAYAGLELEDIRYPSFEAFLAVKDKITFGQVPALDVDDGKHELVQSAAIMRYLSKLVGLYPEDPILAAKVDAALDQETDAFAGATVVTYDTRFGLALDEASKTKAYEVFSNEILPRHLRCAEKCFEASSTGWIAGTEEPSMADFVWYSKLVDFIPEHPNLSSTAKDLSPYPACQAFVEKFRALEAIQAYYAGKE
jgi:prostaglandin-H2 D-isomerase / glutathione transferase